MKKKTKKKMRSGKQYETLIDFIMELEYIGMIILSGGKRTIKISLSKIRFSQKNI